MTDITFDTCTCGSVVVSGAQAVAELKAENEKLRATLRDIAAGQVTYLPFIQTVARAALEEKQ